MELQRLLIGLVVNFACVAGLRVGGRVPLPAVSTDLPARRDVLAQGAAFLLGSASALPALAEVKGVNSNMPRGDSEVAKFLKSQGFKPLPKVDGLSPLVQYIGSAPPANIDGMKAKERAYTSTLLVRFLYPSAWLVETPTLTENGEAGKIAANNYLKGDSADFVAVKLPEGQTLGDINKEFYKGFLSSQMASDVFEDVRVKKVRQVTADDGSELAYIDFTYTLLTRAGFTVQRKGVATAEIASGALVGLVIATTADRFPKLESDFRACAESFRANPVKTPAFAGGVV